MKRKLRVGLCGLDTIGWILSKNFTHITPETTYKNINIFVPEVLNRLTPFYGHTLLMFMFS